MTVEHEARALLRPLRRAMATFEPEPVRAALTAAFAPDAAIRLSHPFEDLPGPDALYEGAYAPLFEAMPDLERRELICMAGRSASGAVWVGAAAEYVGVFHQPWLGVRPTGRPVAFRAHEFFRVEDGRVVEVQALWDLPELMMQAGVWPMGPSLGRDWRTPAPASQDGLMDGDARGAEKAAASLALVSDMLDGLGRFADGGAEAMALERYWHPRMSWYGPAGIGSTRGIDGFRRWHQIPFLNAMPDRQAVLAAGHLFAEGAYVGFTAWPGMRMRLTGDGWLGLPPTGAELTMRSLDFWRCEEGLIRENWVLVDLLHVYAQLGVDLLARARELSGDGRRAAGP